MLNLELLTLLTECHVTGIVTNYVRANTLERGCESTIERRGSEKVRTKLYTFRCSDILRNLDRNPCLSTVPEKTRRTDTKIIVQNGCNVLKQPLLILMTPVAILEDSENNTVIVSDDSLAAWNLHVLARRLANVHGRIHDFKVEQTTQNVVNRNRADIMV
jgi:hypothetical protein